MIIKLSSTSTFKKRFIYGVTHDVKCCDMPEDMFTDLNPREGEERGDHPQVKVHQYPNLRTLRMSHIICHRRFVEEINLSARVDPSPKAPRP